MYLNNRFTLCMEPFCYACVLFWPQYIYILFIMWLFLVVCPFSLHSFLDFSDSLKQAKLKKGKAWKMFDKYMFLMWRRCRFAGAHLYLLEIFKDSKRCNSRGSQFGALLILMDNKRYLRMAVEVLSKNLATWNTKESWFFFVNLYQLSFGTIVVCLVLHKQ